MINRVLIIVALALCGLASAQPGPLPNSGAQVGNARKILGGGAPLPSWCQHLRHPSESVCGLVNPGKPQPKQSDFTNPNKEVTQGGAQRPFSGEALGMTYGILKVGAGGAVTGIDIQCDQGAGKCSPGVGTATRLSRNNTNGAYWFNSATTNCGNAAATGCWQQIVTTTSLPNGDPGISPGGLQGVYDAVIAPSNTSHFWMIFNGYVYSSTNKGTSWVRCSPAQDSTAEANGTASGALGRHIAVDPANEWSVIATFPTAGVLYSDGTGGACGNSWTTISTSSIPSSVDRTSHVIGYLVEFDYHTTNGGSTPGIYVASYSHGVYHTSTGPGGAWSHSAGSPTTFGAMRVDAAGNVWVVDGALVGLTSGGAQGSQGGLKELPLGGAWTSKLPSADALVDVVVNPNTPADVYAIKVQTAAMYVSTDGGATWSTTATGNNTINIPVATDIPWLAYRQRTLLSIFGYSAVFDPTTANTVYVGGGLGIWSTNPPTSQTSPPALTWTSQSAAIEQLVSNEIVAPDTAGAKPILAVWDQCVLQPTVDGYPTINGVTNTGIVNLQSGWSVASTSTSPSTIVAMCQGIYDSSEGPTSGKSTDGGATWAKFANQVSAGGLGIFGGCIAASTATNFLWVQANTSDGTFPVWYTTDGAASAWSQPDGSLSGLTTGWPHNYYDNQQICDADKVTANKFYLYNFGDGSGLDGIYASTNSGLSWTRECTKCAGPSNFSGGNRVNALLKAVPGKAGNLFYTNGFGCGGNPSGALLYYSTNSGSTWTAVSRVGCVAAYGFGAVKPGNTCCRGNGYPSIYIAGYVSVSGTYTWGFWRSDDQGSTWKNVGDGYPLGNFGQIATIDGDKNTWGMFYIGYRSGGAMYGITNFLLHRDLDPAANDNSPAFLARVG